jgi:4-amino-4-deoxy-L-arabinose transferase-like glycosyltransferase
VVLAIVALALVVRALHFRAIASTAFPLLPTVFTESDMSAFLAWANRILDGDWLGRDTYHVYTTWMQAMAPLETWYRWWGGKEVFHQAPLYPYALAVVLGASGGSLTAVLGIQLLLGTAQAVIVYLLARRLFEVRVAAMAGLATALYGPFIFFQGVMLRDWLPPLLEPLALLLLVVARDNGQRWRWLAAGGALGVATLTKETALMLLPVAVLWVVLQSGRAWRAAVGPAVGIVVGFAICLTPLVARNAAVGAPWLAVSGSGPGSFALGHAADSHPVGFRPGPSLKAILQAADGRTLVAVRETLATHHGNWASLAGVELTKLRGLVDPFEVPDNASYDYGQDISAVLRFALGFGVIFPLGVAGVVVAARRGRHRGLLLLYLGCVLFGLAFSIVHARYRLALVPPLIILAAAFVVWVFDTLRAGQIRTAAVAVGLAGVLGIAQQVLAPLTPRGEYVRAHEYFLAAAVYESRRDWDHAAAEMERLRDRARASRVLAPRLPTVEARAHHYHALGLLEAGQPTAAEQQLLDAIASDPRLPAPYFVLGMLHMTAGGDGAAGRRYLERFLELAPVGPPADHARALLARPS